VRTGAVLGCGSEPDFFLVTYRQNNNGVATDAVSGNVAAVAEINDPFSAIIGHVGYQPTNMRLLPQYLQ